VFVTESIGLIGLGLMGSALTRRLVDGGFNVIGFDLDPDQRNAFKKLGGEPAASVADVAARCRRILIAVMTVAQVEDVVMGEGGIAATPVPGNERRLLLSVTTSEPDKIEVLAKGCEESGIDFLDTPVSGTSKHVSEGRGHGLIGGTEAVIEATGDLLDAVYSMRSVTGIAGSATKTKLAINHIGGLNRIALAEGLVFAERLGLDTATFLDVAKQSAVYSKIMDAKGDMMVARDFSPPLGKLSQHLKDVRIMLAESQKRGQELPMLARLLELLEACEARGEGDMDNTFTLEEIRRRHNL
jgi:3-hydroxyisobutyrate dehydrogenase-like beta-hydroxyacid dehydrogenase